MYVSSVLHELGLVAFAEQDVFKAQEMLLSEKLVLDQLVESPAHDQRMLQARLTNLTWLLKCAKELGDDKEARRLAAERNRSGTICHDEHQTCNYVTILELLTCRSKRCSVGQLHVKLHFPAWEVPMRIDHTSGLPWIAFLDRFSILSRTC
jgi:hypothetical protein